MTFFQVPLSRQRADEVFFIEGSNIGATPNRRQCSLPLETKSRLDKRQRVRISSSRQELSPCSEEVNNAVHEIDQIVHAIPAR